MIVLTSANPIYKNKPVNEYLDRSAATLGINVPSIKKKSHSNCRFNVGEATNYLWKSGLETSAAYETELQQYATSSP
jgi:hypothetical protein